MKECGKEVYILCIVDREGKECASPLGVVNTVGFELLPRGGGWRVVGIVWVSEAGSNLENFEVGGKGVKRES